MRSTVLELICATFVIFGFAREALAGDKEPSYLTDPTFQMMYDKRVVEFEPMPLAILQRCHQISYLPNITPVFFIYGQAVDTHGRVFYATGGYEIRTSSRLPMSRKYETGGLGLVFFMEGEKCNEIGSVMETFEAGPFEETTQDILSMLASDMAVRYEKAFHGSKALKYAFRKHRVKPSNSVELNRAFAPYLK